VKRAAVRCPPTGNTLFGCRPGNPLAWDRYSYTGNNPINYVDPSSNMSQMDDNGWVFVAPEKPDDLMEDGEKAYVNIWLYFFHRGEI
jgi:hypothetical protein